nr:MAG TPA: hypothetical protein [Caudoviricetes sp.]
MPTFACSRVIAMINSLNIVLLMQSLSQICRLRLARLLCRRRVHTLPDSASANDKIRPIGLNLLSQLVSIDDISVFADLNGAHITHAHDGINSLWVNAGRFEELAVCRLLCVYRLTCLNVSLISLKRFVFVFVLFRKIFGVAALLGECVHLLLQLSGMICLLLEIVALILERIYRFEVCADNLLDLIVFNSECT